MKRLIIAGTLLALTAAMVAIFASAFGKDTREVPFMLKGKPAPAFNLPMLNGDGRVSLESLKGKPTIINFWASWCRPCLYEHPVLEWGAKEYGQQVNFVGMVFEDTEPEAREFLRRHGGSFPQLFDPESRVQVDYGAAGVPETYFITADGTIVDKHIGPLQPEILSARVRELLGQRRGAMR